MPHRLVHTLHIINNQLTKSNLIKKNQNGKQEFNWILPGYGHGAL